MEEHYDGDTVELIDYLRVMWWGKWIILGCLIIAVGLSVLSVGLQPTPTMYSGSTAILLREYVTAALAGDQDATAAMISAMGFTLATVETAMPGIEASLVDNRITLSRSNDASTDAVRQALVQAVVALEQQLLLALTEELKHLAYKTQLQKTGLTAQLEILQQRLTEELTSGRASLGDALAEQIAGLEVQLSQKQVLLNTLETTEPGDLFVISPIGGPTITASAPGGKTTIAVAAFLGLMIGVLLAFFVHYLLQIRVREREEEKARSA